VVIKQITLRQAPEAALGEVQRLLRAVPGPGAQDSNHEDHNPRLNSASGGLHPDLTPLELRGIRAISGLLVALLLPALGRVMQRSRAAQTLAPTEEFGKACDAYFQEFGEYPATIPNAVLYAGVTDNPSDPSFRRTARASRRRRMRSWR